eukprot:TRINITY_DN3674_c0_g1_i3.p1 TRINITY_DN3674_c0_g1~~TRINITY_DN3674_c0_g1_i3.p1  ORF type:complete len:115 (+),score=14.72 TRINITY_DN3674_c0_g1_i3:32-346(+)
MACRFVLLFLLCSCACFFVLGTSHRHFGGRPSFSDWGRDPHSAQSVTQTKVAKQKDQHGATASSFVSISGKKQKKFSTVGSSLPPLLFPKGGWQTASDASDIIP